jgi:beta-galactosidase
MPSLVLTHSGDKINIKTAAIGGWEVQFDKSTGLLDFWQVEGASILLNGPLPCFWRAPTDNDKGGSGLSYLSQWQKCGLDTLTLSHCTSFEFKHICPQLIVATVIIFMEPKGEVPPRPNVSESQSGDVVQSITTPAALSSSGDTGSENQPKKSRIEGLQTATSVHFKVEVEYKVFGNGDIMVNYKINPSPKLSPLPRVGVQFNVEKQCGEVEWYGRGPFECYPDRKAAAQVGIYKMGVEELHVPYIVPGESGGRADVRWVAFRTRGAGVGLLAMCGPGSPPMQMSANVYSIDELNQATHNEELQPGENIEVHLDHKHMGVGGDDSWTPSVHSQYLVMPKPYEFSIRFCALTEDRSPTKLVCTQLEEVITK